MSGLSYCTVKKIAEKRCVGREKENVKEWDWSLNKHNLIAATTFSWIQDMMGCCIRVGVSLYISHPLFGSCDISYYTLISSDNGLLYSAVLFSSSPPHGNDLHLYRETASRISELYSKLHQYKSKQIA